MLSEHNPIAELIHQIQKKWTDEVSPFPELKLLRWIIKPDEARLFEGFLKLESTEHGAIPEVLVAMLTPFENEYTHTNNIIDNWENVFKEDQKTQEKLLAKGLKHIWKNTAPDTPVSGQYSIDKLFGMLFSFRNELIDKTVPLVIALFPYTINDIAGYNRWLKALLKQQVPDKVAFMIFDHVGENYFDDVFNKYPEITKSLHIDLDLDGAVSRIAKMGDPNAPEVKLRECILEMGKSVQNKNKDRLHEWGEKALRVTQKSNVKSIYASAFIAYAGMLFNFKQFDKIDSLLEQGLHITKKGLSLDDGACKPLMIQYYGYIAASKQLQNKTIEAISAYEKQGDLAAEYQLPGMALTPYQQAYHLSGKKLPHRYEELIRKAFSAGMSLQNEEQRNSSFPGIALDYVLYLRSRKGWESAEQTELELTKLLGKGWKEKAKNPGAAYSFSPLTSTTLT